MIRLDRLLSSRGYCTRSSARGFLKECDVRERDVRLAREDQKVDGNAVTIDGEPADAEQIVAMLHKPVGVVCSHDEGEGQLVYDLLPERWSQRNPAVTTVGRLDKETSGLLIVTDDGALVHRLTSPKKHVAKTYVATLERPLRGDEAPAFASGTMTLHGEERPLRPATMSPIDAHTVRLTIVEGRYHQVRRMFAAMSNRVVTLHRERIGDLTLDDLAPGAWRMIDPAALAAATKSL